MHVFVNATYITDLLLSPSTPPRSRMGDLLQSSEVLSKLSAIMAGESTTEGEGWPKDFITGVEVCGWVLGPVLRAEAQNLKNSAEYFKIDPAKKSWRLQVAKAAMAVNEGTRVAKNDFWPETVQKRVV